MKNTIFIKQLIAVPLISAQMVLNLIPAYSKPVDEIKAIDFTDIILDTNSPVPLVSPESRPEITLGKSRYQEEQERIESERVKQEQLAKTRKSREVLPRNDSQRPADSNCDQGCVINLIERYSRDYGVNSNLTLAIAKAESGFNCVAKNRRSTASGVYQYLAGTWRNTPEGRQGLSVFDCEANVRAAVRHIAVRGTAPWNASKHAWGN